MEIETITPPIILNPKNVCYWYPRKKELEGTQFTKAKKFLSLGLIRFNADHSFSVLPIKGYNITTYLIKDGECNCQFYCKTKRDCSHILAIKLYKFMRNWNNLNKTQEDTKCQH